MTLDDLKSDLEDEIKHEFEDLMEYPRQADDRLREMADSSVPIYHKDRAEVLASAPYLEVEDPCGETSIMGLIGIAIHEELIEHDDSTFDGLKTTFEDLKDTAESDCWEAVRMNGKWAITKADEDSEDFEETPVEGESSETAAWIKFFEQNGDW